MDREPPIDPSDFAERWEQYQRSESANNTGHGETKTKPPPPFGYRFEVITSADFARADYRQGWLIRKLMVKNQPVIVGGPKKVLKTSLLIDLALSLGTGTPFLGTFQVEHPVRTVLLSGESGAATLQETARRIALAKGIRLEDADVLWGFELPRMTDAAHLGALKTGLIEAGAEVLIIDPLYLSLLAGAGPGGPRAENVFDMGPLLLQIAQLCLDVGVTLILIHHTRKNVGLEPIELDELAYAGCAEFARQWLLISRREKYEPGTGCHKLWLNVGGSAGHGGLWSVDVDEGVINEDFGGRHWTVDVHTATEARQSVQSQRDQQRRQKENDQDRQDDDAIMAALDRLDPQQAGHGWNRIQDVARLSDSRMVRAVVRLRAARLVEETSVEADIGSGAKRQVKGIRRVRDSG